MILCHAEHEKIFGMSPVGFGEFPEGTSKCIHATRSHIDGTKAAMGCVVGGAKLLGPPAGQGLALVPTSEEGQFLRVGCPNF